MGRKKNQTKYDNLTEDEQEQVNLENLKIKILELKQNIAQNTINLGMYLCTVKERLGHGEFGKWLEETVDFTERTARRFMKVYKTTVELDKKYDVVIGNLNSSQLVEISNLKKADIENLLENENVKDMSIRELQEVIKNYKQVNKKTKQNKTDNVVRFEEEKSTIAETPTSLTIKSDISEIWEHTVQLNKELHMRVGSDEDLETTLTARYNAKEISHQEFIDIVAKEKLNLPIFFYKEALEEYLDRTDFYSDYERWDRNSNKYYSLFSKYFLNFSEAIISFNTEDEDCIDYSNNCFIERNNIIIAELYDENRYLLLYVNNNLVGQYYEGEWKHLENGILEHYNLDKDTIQAMYDTLQEQLQAYQIRRQARWNKKQEELKKEQERKKKAEETFKSWQTYYQPWTMGKWTYEQIWNENGDVINWKAWREMTDYVTKARRKASEDWSSGYDYSKLFGNKTPAIKEEDKPQYKRLYRILAKQCHPDICHDDGTLMQLTNKLKEDWEI